MIVVARWDLVLLYDGGGGEHNNVRLVQRRPHAVCSWREKKDKIVARPLDLTWRTLRLIVFHILYLYTLSDSTVSTTKLQPASSIYEVCLKNEHIFLTIQWVDMHASGMNITIISLFIYVTFVLNWPSLPAVRVSWKSNNKAESDHLCSNGVGNMIFILFEAATTYAEDHLRSDKNVFPSPILINLNTWTWSTL